MVYDAVPESFIHGNDPSCLYSNKSLNINTNCNSIECECVEGNEKCRNMLWFFTETGRFSSGAMTFVLYQEVASSNQNQFACTLEAMIENIVYPAFLKRFGKRFSRMQEKHWGTMKTEEECNEYGIDCKVALNKIKLLLQKFFRIYHIFNGDFATSKGSETGSNQRYHGSLLANMNFLLGDVAQNRIHSTPAYVQMKKDLAELTKSYNPLGNLALPDLIRLLGYSEGYGTYKQSPIIQGNVLNDTSQTEMHCNIDRLNQYWDIYANKGSFQYSISILTIYFDFLSFKGIMSIQYFIVIFHLKDKKINSKMSNLIIIHVNRNLMTTILNSKDVAKFSAII